MDMPIEGLHTETGPGVLEAAILYTDALAAADRAVLFKTFSKVWAERQGKMLTFMAKWSSAYPGQSGHLHLSLRDKDGNPAFYQSGRPGNMSDTMRWFVGGQQALLPELLAMVASTVNSYRVWYRASGRRRMRPGESRTAPVRCGSFPESRRASAWNIGSLPRISIRTLRSPRRWDQGSGGSSTRSNRASQSPGMPMSERTRPSGRFRARCRKPPSD